MRKSIRRLSKTLFSIQSYFNAEPIIYVIDDDADVQKYLNDLLRSVGLSVACCSTAKEFRERNGFHKTNCIIINAQLPGTTGIEFQAELTKANIKIPIIFTADQSDMRICVNAMKAGAVEFLQKPFREQEMLAAVFTALIIDRTRRELEYKTAELHDRFDLLTGREWEILKLVCAGLMNKNIATELSVSEITVKVHRHNIMKKLGAKSLVELVRMVDGLERSSVDCLGLTCRWTRNHEGNDLARHWEHLRQRAAPWVRDPKSIALKRTV